MADVVVRIDILYLFCDIAKHLKFPIKMGDDDDGGDGRSWVREDTPLLLNDSSLPSTPLHLPLLATDGAV